MTYTITASNRGNPPTSTTIKLAVVAQAPTSLSYSPSSFSFTFNETYVGEFPAPSSGGDPVGAYSISPTTLPTGLTFDNTTGQIHGTPEEIYSLANFTVTASNTGGTTTTTVSIEVLPEAPKCLSYGGAGCSDQKSYTLRVNQDFSVTPTLNIADATAGGATLTYSISTTTSLPAGLVFNTSTGTIAGKPTTLQYPAQPYQVTVSNGADTTSDTEVDISVLDVPPTNLEYPTSGFTYPAYTADRYQYTRGVAASSTSALAPTHLGALHCGV